MGKVTGIGDFSENKNLITPDIDADLYNYILNKDAIINGLQIVGNTLTAGMCVLKGYRGILENDEPVGTEELIYGKFTLYFNNEIPDEFDIIKTNSIPQDGIVNPESITGAGIYYLKLYRYSDGQYKLSDNLSYNYYGQSGADYKYPLKAYEADETNLLRSAGTIAEGATAWTQKRNSHNASNPNANINRLVATTEYVHNQIEEEIAYSTENVSMAITYVQTIGGRKTLRKTFTIKRKAKYVIAKIENITGYIGNGFSSQTIATIPNGYRPSQQVYGCFVCTTSETIEGQISPYISVNPIRLTISTNGVITIDAKSFNYATITQGQIVIGYETN